MVLKDGAPRSTAHSGPCTRRFIENAEKPLCARAGSEALRTNARKRRNSSRPRVIARDPFAGVRRPAPSAAREGQPERGHLLAVAIQQDVTGQNRVVPGLALERREPRELRELIGDRPDQRQLTLFRQHQKQVLIGQQDELAVAVASALPLALAVLEVDAREDAAVEAEGIAIMNDEVVEVGLQPIRGPALFDGPSAGSTRDREAARAAAVADALPICIAIMNDEVVEVGLQPIRGPALFDGPSAGSTRDREAARAAAVADADQDVAVRGQGRLHDGVAWPWVLPEQRAVGERDAGRAGFAQKQDLLDSVDGQ